MDIDEVDETLPPIDDQDQKPLTQTENPAPPTPNENETKDFKLSACKGRERGGKAVAYNKEACRVALTQYIVLDELPFRHVEGEGFKRFVKTLQPRFEIPSRMTVGGDVLKLYKEENVTLKNILSRERISNTTDTWTSIQNLNYTVITAH
ncbi:zinc finger BED domain-containing protein DAYSLEEPER-like [Humulus lupulus]|uniref:zinc finger BED domain-containing protein DAYSLEEPER-like n=1 Tax=Humulus lupulus TaxID=3486 RepID=UPI002B408882|nr:zinc finger BED domain-containing protein DAYSLEEPER-like [Humulus lupulus]